MTELERIMSIEDEDECMRQLMEYTKKTSYTQQLLKKKRKQDKEK